MKKYQWNSTVLQKRSKVFNRLSLVCMVLALACYFALPTYAVVALVFLVVGCGLVWLAVAIQGKDKRLQRKR